MNMPMKGRKTNKFMIPFNREYWIEQLLKEVGLMGTPYAELDKHEVELDSPTGRASGFKVNAKTYVDQQLLFIENEYNNQPEPVSFESFTPEMPLEVVQLPEIKLQEVKPENIRFFVVSVFPPMEYVVIINDDGEWQSQDQINQVKDPRFFKGEKKREELTGSEDVISFYQYLSTVSLSPRQQQDLTAFEKITGNMDTVFDGLKMQGIL